jgi:hypothetical protein
MELDAALDALDPFFHRTPLISVSIYCDKIIALVLYDATRYRANGRVIRVGQLIFGGGDHEGENSYPRRWWRGLGQLNGHPLTRMRLVVPSD